MMMNGHQFTSAAVTDRGLNPTRPQNEDSYLELQQHGVFVVADGVGGAQAGEVASQMAVEILGEAFVNIADDADPEETMRIAIERANGAIYQMSQDLPQLASMATTLVAMHVAGDIATIAHVGDSRIYRVDPNGRLFRETDDHSVVEEEVRAGRMTPEQALYHPSRNVISRALGAEETVDPDIKMLIVHPATKFLLCSDGITRHIEDSEIESLLASDKEPAEVCSIMKEMCFERGAEDNLTAVIVDFPGENLPVEAIEAEQVTIAAARPPFDAVVNAEAIEQGYETISMDDELELPDNDEIDGERADILVSEETDDGAYLLENPDGIYLDEPLSERIEVEQAKPETFAPREPTRSVMSYEAAGEGPGFLSKTVSAIFLLIAGVLIGSIGGYFVFQAYQPRAEVPVIPEQKSNNVPLTAFEETRRLVDANPETYINARAATPQTADDFFWLGRAHLLTAKYVEAGREFTEARNRLSQADAANVKTMAAEIGMAMAIIDNFPAQQYFTKTMSAGSSIPASNVNSNGVSGNVRPQR